MVEESIHMDIYSKLNLMKIKRFNQIFESLDPFIINEDTIKELCLEMTEEVKVRQLTYF